MKKAEQVVAESQAAAPREALVAGASGLTGAALLQLLLRQGDHVRVHALSRRPLPVDHPRLANRILRLEDLGPRVTGLRCQDAFCCLGAAGGPAASEPALRAVDLELVLTFARIALATGATRLVVVSAAGASRGADSPFLRVKGEAEAALRALPFTSLDLLQPGPVLGMRPGGGAGDLLRLAVLPLANPLLRGAAAARRALPAADLAAAMLGAARSQRRGVTVWTGQSLRDLAAAGTRPS